MGGWGGGWEDGFLPSTSKIGEGRLCESQIWGCSDHHPGRRILSLEPSHCSLAILPLGICSFSVLTVTALSDYLCKERGLEEPSLRRAGGIPCENS